MEAGWIRFVICALLGFDTLSYILSLYIPPDNEKLKGENCSLYPRNASFPCMQYKMYHVNDCENLSAVFPHVYSIDNTDTAPWPGPVASHNTGPASINWTAPAYGGVHFLKGFQIILIGLGYDSYIKLCAVIDLTNTTELDIRAIRSTTFSAGFDVPGEYLAEISALPLPPASESNEVQATVPSIPTELHTNLKVVFKWKQSSATCLNYTLVFEQDVAEITEVHQEVLDDQNTLLMNTYTDVEFRHKQIHICNLAPGNYTLQVTPVDPNNEDPSRCVCYSSTGDYKTCERCDANIISVYIEPIRYYPDVKVKFNYHQSSSSCFTYTLEFEPANNDIHYIRRDLLDANDKPLKDARTEIEFKNKRTQICGLVEGNYTLQVTPIDNNPTRCICYNKAGDYIQCVPCHAYVLHVHMDTFSQPINESHHPVAVIVASTLVSALVLAVIVFVLIIYRRRQCFFMKNKQFIDTNNRSRRTKTVYVIYARDHAPHKHTVNKFADLIKGLLSCRVRLHDQHVIRATSTESLSSLDNTFTGGINSADVICCIHSEWSNKLAEKALSEVFYIKNNSNADDEFVASVHEIRQNEHLKSKLISVHFDYTSPSFVLRDPSMGPVFSITSDMEAFSQQAKTMLNMKQTTISQQETNNLKGDLVSAMEAVINYQKINLNWVSKKLFDNQTSVSSNEDSGIILPRRTHSRYRSSRSRSAETTACSVCRCTMHSRRHVCSSCGNHEVARMRTNSCDLSFVPPDFDYDDISVRYSLLENKFVAINDRYDYIVRHKFDLDDDCLTIDGKSV